MKRESEPVIQKSCHGHKERTYEPVPLGPLGPPLASKDSRELKSRASTYPSPKGLANAAGAMKKGRRTRNAEECIAGVLSVLSRVCVEQTGCFNFLPEEWETK
jgi:hypothetical protein